MYFLLRSNFIGAKSNYNNQSQATQAHTHCEIILSEFLTWNKIVSVLLLRLLRHSIFMRTSLLSSSVRGTGSLVTLVVMMAASQGRSGEPAIRNLVTTWTCMKSTANKVMAVA